MRLSPALPVVLLAGLAFSLGADIAAASHRAAPTPTPAARAVGTAAANMVASNVGYYRSPTTRNGTIVFVSEGDLWRVPAAGGSATRVTSHAGVESDPAISPDGQTLAFIASYEGEREVYTMPMAGGLPTRRTYDGTRRIVFVGWSPDGKLLYSTEATSTLPRERTFSHDLATDARTLIPLEQCADATLSPDGKTLIFTRLAFQGSFTDRYKGGTAQNLWRFEMPAPGAEAKEATEAREASPLTADYPGTSKRPIWAGDRVCFLTDRSGSMNVWSMRPDGTDAKAVTSHTDFKVGSYSIDGSTLVYQLGADLLALDLSKPDAKPAPLPITLASDMDQTRERWVPKPAEFISSAHLSEDGSRVAITARGRVFNAAVKPKGRLVDVDPREGIRYREARFLPDGKSLVALSDESGEVELATLPALGVGSPQGLTAGAEVLRWKAIPSPDGTKLLHTDKNQRLYVLDVATKASTLIHQSTIDQIDDFSWSPDGRYVAYVTQSPNNTFRVIKIWDSQTSTTLDATTERYDSYSPTWTSDGKFLAFLSDRTFTSLTTSPWGPRQPEPFLDEPTKLYLLALKPGSRSPFVPDDELTLADKDAKEKAKDKEKDKPKDDAKPGEKPSDRPADKPAADDAAPDKKTDPVKVEIDPAGLATRIIEVPTERGNFSSLFAGEKALFWLSYDAKSVAESPDGPPKAELYGLEITDEKPEAKLVAGDIAAFELSGDRKKILLQKDEGKLFVIDAKPAEANLKDAAVDLSGWALSVTPRDEWRQMTIEAWRLLRDYFYDRNMHGVDWKATLAKYLPLAERIRSRDELSDLLAQMTGELSALHHFVAGGDLRRGTDRIGVASLGAELTAVPEGFRVDTIHQGDPDEPQLRSPLLEPGVNVAVGDVITTINGQPVVGLPHIGKALRAKAGQQVLLHIKPAAGPERDAIIKPISAGEGDELRYRAWEVSRRTLVDQWGEGKIGYVHLRAMGGENFSEWARDYYPVFNRSGLIIDVRDNRGGNIDSWILNRLLRKVWMFWNQPVGRNPGGNMQYAFRGHLVVLCNESTASDGEAFTEGFRRMGLGKSIGTRTWGGGIWLSFSNYLVDKGIASAGEYGSFGADGQWLVEGTGVTPDIIVDNLPAATFAGQDAQLRAGIDHLKKLIAEKPVELPPVPATPNKAR